MRYDFARWWLRLTGPANSTGRGRTVERRPVQAQRRPAMDIRHHAPRFCPVAAAPYRACEFERKGKDRRPVQAQRRPAMDIRRHAPRFCPVAAAPYRAYEIERKGKDCRPVQAQRRPAMGIRRHAPRFARWRLRLTGPASSRGRGRTVGRCKRSAARQRVSGAMRHVLPGGGCALPGLGTREEGEGPQAGASAASPGNGYPAPCATFCPVAAAPYRACELHRRGRTAGRCKRSAARQWASGAMRKIKNPSSP
ncbi:Uncharacterised protein [Klebsiella quasipneumoniae]|nr:Uncharacterised protein [Klebsiella quasipneumoniae]